MEPPRRPEPVNKPPASDLDPFIVTTKSELPLAGVNAQEIMAPLVEGEKKTEKSKPKWSYKKEGDLNNRRTALEEKIPPALLKLLHTKIVEYHGAQNFAVRAAISSDRVELLVLNMLGNLVEKYEQDLGVAFPKENALFALVHYLSMKSQDKAITDIFTKIQVINQSNLSDAEKNAHKGLLFSNLGSFMLATAFPKGAEDLEFGYLNKPIYNLVYYGMPWLGPVLGSWYVEPTVQPVAKTHLKQKELEERIKDPDIIRLAHWVSVLVKGIIADQMIAMGKEGLTNAKKTELETELYKALGDLGAGKSEAFKQLTETLGNYAYPITLHLLSHLIAGKPEGVDPLVYIVAKLLIIQRREVAAIQQYLGQQPETFTLEDLKQVPILSKISMDVPVEPVKNTPVQRLADFINSRTMLTRSDLGLDAASIKDLVPIKADQVVNDLHKLIVTALTDYVAGARLPLVFDRPIEDYKSAEQTIDAIMGGKVFPTIDDLLKSHQDEDLDRGRVTEIDPEKEKKRLGTVLASTVNKALPKEQGISANFFINSFSQLLKDPTYIDFKKPLQEYATKYVTAILGNFAVAFHGPGASPIEFWPAVMNHLIDLLKKEIKDPALLEQKILLWKRMPSVTPEQKAVKELFRQNELLPDFKSAAAKVVARTKLKEDRFLPMPGIIKNPLVNGIENDILPDLLFDFAQGFAILSSLSEQQIVRLSSLNNVGGLHQMGLDAAAQIATMYKTALSGNAATIAHAINENLANNALTPQQEVALGEAVQKAVPSLPDALIRGLAERFLPEKLKKLASAFKGLYTGDARGLVMVQLRVRFKEAKIAPKIYRKIHAFYENEKNKKIQDLETRLAVLRDQLLPIPLDEEQHEVTPPAPPEEKIYAEIESLNRELIRAKGSVAEQKARQAHYEPLLAAFRPLTKTLLGDLGIESPADLPLPEIAQEATYLSLVDSVIPEQLMRTYYYYLRFGEGSKQHKQELDAQFGKPPGQKHSDVVNAITAYSYLAVYFLDNWLVANTEETSVLIGEAMRPTVLPGGQLLPQLPVQAPRKFEPGQNIMLEGRRLGESRPGGSEFLFPVIQKEIKGILLDIVNNFVKNLQRINDSAEFRPLILDVINLLTGHLDAINRVAKGRRPYDIPPSEIAEELLKTGQANPAYPDLQTLKTIDGNVGLIATNQLLKLELEGAPDSDSKTQTLALEKEIEDLRLLNKSINEKIQKKLENDFYSKVILWVLAMANKRGPKDLAVAPELQPVIWKLLTKAGPEGLAAAFSTLSSTDTLNTLLAKTVVKLNKTLDKWIEDAAKPKPKAEPSKYPENAVFAEAFARLLGQVGKALPGTWTETLLREHRFVGSPVNFLGKLIESNVRDILNEYSIRVLLQMALTPPEPDAEPLVLSVTKEELAKEDEAKRAEIQQSIEKFNQGAKKLPEQIRGFINEASKKGWMVWGASTAFHPIIQKFLNSLEGTIAKTSDPLRLSITEVQPHMNLVLNCLTALMRHYPAPPPPSSPPAARPKETIPEV